VNLRLIPILFIIPLLISGCASNDQYVHYPDQTKVVEDPGKGRIYLIRPKLAGVGISPDITNDGEAIGCTSPRGFLCWEREPGSTTISGKTDSTSVITVEVKAGEVTYIIQTIDFGWVTTENRLELATEQEGKAALKKSKPPFCYLLNATPYNKVRSD